jgi:hypothetical protein
MAGRDEIGVKPSNFKHFLFSICGLMSLPGVKCGNIYSRAHLLHYAKDKGIYDARFMYQISNSQDIGLNNHWTRFHGVNEVLSAQQIMHFPFSLLCS